MWHKFDFVGALEGGHKIIFKQGRWGGKSELEP